MQQNADHSKFKEFCEEFHSHYKLNPEFLFEAIKDLSEPEINKLEPKIIGIQFLLHNCVAQDQKSFYAYIKQHENEKGIKEIHRTMETISKLILGKSGQPFTLSEQLRKEQIQAQINLDVGRNSMVLPILNKPVLDPSALRRKSTLVPSNQVNHAQKSTFGRTYSMKVDYDETMDTTSQGAQEKKNILTLGGEIVKSFFGVMTPSNLEATKQNSSNALSSYTRESGGSHTGDLNQYTNQQRRLSSFNIFDKGSNNESSNSSEKEKKSLFLKKYKSTADDYQTNEEKKQISKLKKHEDLYLKNYGLNTVKVDFMFSIPKNIPEIYDNLKKMPVLKESPKDKDIKFDIVLLKQWSKEYILITGEFHKHLHKAYLELLEKKQKIEVDYNLRIHKDNLDLCVKMKYNEDTDEIVSKFRKISNMKNHEIKRQMKKKKDKPKKKEKSQPKKYFPLKIKAVFRGPQIQCNTISVWKDEDGIIIDDQQIVSKLCEIRMISKETSQDQLLWLTMGKNKLILAQEIGSFPYILNPENGNKMRISKSSSVKKVWDYLDTFQPAQEFGTQSEKHYSIQRLDPNSFEYDYVAYKFGATFEGQDKTTLTIRKTLKKMASERISTFQNKITKIEKVINSVLFEKLKHELQSMLLTSNLKRTEEIVKHLFYGNSERSPETIYSSKHGLDTKVHLEGQKSYGAYLCDNSHQAHVYSYTKGHHKQMFMCLTLTGQSAKHTSDENNKQPPRKLNSQDRYDSVYLKDKGRFIIYDSSKIYPGYLITYK